MDVMDGPLEPSSSTASNIADVPDDHAFVNFFSVCAVLFALLELWKLDLAFSYESLPDIINLYHRTRDFFFNLS